MWSHLARERSFAPALQRVRALELDSAAFPMAAQPEVALVTCYTVRCPLGEQCSKKGGILAKKESEEEARKAVHWHLKASPYHELAEDECEFQSLLCKVEVTEEERTVVETANADEGPAWYANRKRKVIGAGPSGAQFSGTIAASSSASSQQQHRVPSLALSTLPIVARRAGHEEMITVNRIQLQACVDSLRRAKSAAESAGQLCAKASRAFLSEAACIQNCQDVLETYPMV